MRLACGGRSIRRLAFASKHIVFSFNRVGIAPRFRGPYGPVFFSFNRVGNAPRFPGTRGPLGPRLNETNTLQPASFNRVGIAPRFRGTRGPLGPRLNEIPFNEA